MQRSLFSVSHKLKGTALNMCFNVLAKIAMEINEKSESKKNILENLLVELEEEYFLLKELIKQFLK